MRAANENGSDRVYLNNAVGALWTLGRAVSWPAWYGDAEPARVPLPGYPFERQRYALDW
jgi:acyl transferase domain-containing protein